MQLTETSQNYWEKLAVDLKGPLSSGQSIFVLTDYKLPNSYIITRTTDIIIKQMEQVVTMFGYPDTVVSDNGTQFTSSDFELYLQTHNIKH